jgi:hypothetical protein
MRPRSPSLSDLTSYRAVHGARLRAWLIGHGCTCICSFWTASSWRTRAARRCGVGPGGGVRRTSTRAQRRERPFAATDPLDPLRPRHRWHRLVRPAPRRVAVPRVATVRLTRRPRGTSRHVGWAELLWRTFGVFGAACPTCGAVMRLRAVVWPPATLDVLAFACVDRRGARRLGTRRLEPEGRATAATGPATCVLARRKAGFGCGGAPFAPPNEGASASKPPPK